MTGSAAGVAVWTVYPRWRAVQAYRAAEATAPERARTPHEVGISLVVGRRGFPIDALILHGILKPVGSYPAYIPVRARRYYLDETVIPRRSSRQTVFEGLALLGSAVGVLAIVWWLLSLMD